MAGRWSSRRPSVKVRGCPVAAQLARQWWEFLLRSETPRAGAMNPARMKACQCGELLPILLAEMGRVVTGWNSSRQQPIEPKPPMKTFWSFDLGKASIGEAVRGLPPPARSFSIDVMNRIYQGRVSDAEIADGKNWKPFAAEPKAARAAWERALWEHHELFQDAVNFNGR